ncbi:MAG: chemotaxis protein CheB [Burkholderiales bacterium]|nr:chemotaxis protein CheB [Anaerolineae bacterium]
MKIANPNFVVGIGASAGGLNAYKAFFEALPSDTGMAFVVISHIHPAAHSQLAEILSRHSKMTVMLAASAMKIRANQVYVIPGNADLLIENGALRVVSPRTSRNSQIDLFFSSLATAMGARAVGIVFSGYDGDGAEGCRRIKAVGGTTFAQDASAEVNGMPLSAQATGCVDFVLPPNEIPTELQKMTAGFVNLSKLGDSFNP